MIILPTNPTFKLNKRTIKSSLFVVAGVGLVIPGCFYFEKLDALIYIGLILVTFGGLFVTVWYLGQLTMEIGVENFDNKYHIHLYGNKAFQPDIARKPSLTSVRTKRRGVAKIHPDSISRKSIPEECEGDFREVVQLPRVQDNYQSLSDIDGFEAGTYGGRSNIVFKVDM